MLCLGLKGENDRPLGGFDVAPYCDLPKAQRTKFKVDNKACVTEAERRVVANAMQMNVRPKNWNTKRLREWLVSHPILDEDDKRYLIAAKNAIWTAHKSHVAQPSSKNITAQERAPSWTGDLPYLRMHLSSVEDEVKGALLQSGNALNRSQLDARNSTERPTDFFVALANKWNDESFCPETIASPDLHSDFAEPMQCPFSSMPGKVTPEFIKKKWQECKSRLSKVASRYDQSGNGDGQRETETESESTGSDSDNHWAHMTAERLVNGAKRESFMWEHLGERPHLLHLWQLADEHEILQHVVTKLDPKVAASGELVATDTSNVQRARGRPRGSTSKNKRTLEEEDQESSARKHRERTAAALDEQAYQAAMENHREACKELHALKLSRLKCQNDEEKELHTEFIEKEETRILQLEERMRRYSVSRTPPTTSNQE